ncbi:MBL fold metallo-hydrolase [Nitratireductor sp. ZSWI3]|uniref:MBL fold metallo-hydrolase n=1 Tax=Nitratireductor sp. ZSWI3 TaxID=2966359 RepID=UPI00214F7DC8|nr:MBL fold metallo-hydrolase [Nitratireductor sp. ZSWI3]MCR4268374.1 MBL fold metallo-hydrolase [Nitratireductor sp. ZSWI3]
MNERLVLLGTKGGPALRPGGPMPTSTLLQIGGRSAVIDCGLGVTRGLVDAGVPLKTLDLVFITHLHSDHVLELGALLHTAWTAGLASPVKVFGPVGTKDVWAHFCRSLAYDIDIRIDDEGRPDIRTLVEVVEFGEGLVMDEGGLTVDALRVDHPPVTECYALRFSHGGRRIVFSADTNYFPPLAGFAAKADVLVHEAMLSAGVDRLVARTGNGARLKEHLMASHTLAEDAGRIASEAGCAHLVLNHLIPADDPDFGPGDWEAVVRRTFSGPLTIGRDGLELPLGKSSAAPA